MKTTSNSYKTAQLDDLKIAIREARDPQTCDAFAPRFKKTHEHDHD
jgi:hypothetical protein